MKKLMSVLTITVMSAVMLTVGVLFTGCGGGGEGQKEIQRYLFIVHSGPNGEIDINHFHPTEGTDSETRTANGEYFKDFADGTHVTLSAEPEEGYVLTGWLIKDSDTTWETGDKTVSFTVHRDYEVTAVFAEE